MTTQVLEGMRIGIIAADGFEQVEVTRPLEALERHGAEVEIISLRRGSIRGMNSLYPGKKLRVDRTISDAHPDDYHGLHIPGGFISPDFLRQSESVLDFVREFDARGKPIATICHGPWVLISAGLVEGRRLASWPGIKDDVRNAGGEWVDKKVVRDDNWVSSRSPLDLRAFDKAIVEHFADAAGRDTPRALADLPWGQLVLGGVALAAAGYVARERLRRDIEQDPDRYVGYDSYGDRDWRPADAGRTAPLVADRSSEPSALTGNP